MNTETMNTETMIKACEAIVPNNNLKTEINHILIDEENMVATDTIMMVICPHGEEIKEKALMVNNKAKYEILVDGVIFNRYPCNSTWSETYPDYKRILPEDIEKNRRISANGENLIYAMYRVTHDKGVIFGYVNFAPKLKKLDKLLGEVDYAVFTAKDRPVMFVFKNGVKFIIMPIVM